MADLCQKNTKKDAHFKAYSVFVDPKINLNVYVIYFNIICASFVINTLYYFSLV